MAHADGPRPEVHDFDHVGVGAPDAAYIFYIMGAGTVCYFADGGRPGRHDQLALFTLPRDSGFVPAALAALVAGGCAGLLTASFKAWHPSSLSTGSVRGALA